MVFVACFCFTVSPAIAQAFEFGTWQSGMSMKEVTRIAKQRNVSLTKGEGKIGKILGLVYTDKVLGGEARITLAFTPDKKLHMLIIVWRECYIPTRVKFDLNKKYGEPMCEESKKFLMERCTWWSDTYTKIRLEKEQTKISLIYWDWSLVKTVAAKKTPPPA